MRLAVWLLVGGLIPALAGCATHDEYRAARLVTIPNGRPAELASAMLFDARPGRYDPQDFAGRSDWPSTNVFYSPGQVIFYSERFVDHQYTGFGDSLGTYRRADSLRVGVGYR